MKKRPLIVTVLALGYLLAPLWNILKFVFMYKTNPFDTRIFYSMYGVHALIATVLTLIVGFGIWKMHKWGFYAVIFHAVLVITNNFVLFFTKQTDENFWFVLVFFISLLSIILVFLKKEIYAPYFNPSLRWWEQAKRYMVSVSVKIYELGTDTLLLESKCFDISETGLFVIFDNKLQNDIIDINKNYSIEVFLSDTFKLSTEVKSMWFKSKKDGDIPAGGGFKFIDISKVKRKAVRQIVNNLKPRERK